MSDDYGQEIDWRAVAARQTEYLTEQLVSAWGTDITDDLRKVMRRIVGGIGTDEQKTLAEAITALRTRIDTLQGALDEAQPKLDIEDMVSILQERLLAEVIDVPNVRGVIFPANDWDNGDYLSESNAYVVYLDGSTEDVDLYGSGIEDMLTEYYGRVARSAAFGVRLAAASERYEDHEKDVQRWLRIKDKPTG